MAESAPEISLWREGWAACKRSVRILLPLILAFTFLTVICDFYSMRDQIQDIHEKIQAIQGGAMPEDHQSPPAARLASLCASLLQVIGFYYFLSAFLRREPITRPPAQDSKTFFMWFGQTLLAGLCVLGFILGTGLVSGLVLSLFLGSTGGAVIAAVLAMCASIYAGTRFVLVGPLAISGVPGAVKASWHLSKGQWWRLIWGLMMVASIVSLILMAIFLIPAIALFYYTPATADSTVFVAGLSAMWGFSAVVTLASISVFCCVAARILMREQGLHTARESGSIIT